MSKSQNQSPLSVGWFFSILLGLYLSYKSLFLSPYIFLYLILPFAAWIFYPTFSSYMVKNHNKARNEYFNIIVRAVFITMLLGTYITMKYFDTGNFLHPPLTQAEIDAKTEAFYEEFRLKAIAERNANKITKYSNGSSTDYSCDSAPYCTEMSSCEEAEFYYFECGLDRLDRDNDGIPCESICN